MRKTIRSRPAAPAYSSSSQQEGCNTFDQLPIDLIDKVYDQLSLADLHALSGASRLARSVALRPCRLDSRIAQAMGLSKDQFHGSTKTLNSPAKGSRELFARQAWASRAFLPNMEMARYGTQLEPTGFKRSSLAVSPSLDCVVDATAPQNHGVRAFFTQTPELGWRVLKGRDPLGNDEYSSCSVCDAGKSVLLSGDDSPSEVLDSAE